jgi:hypothetical protein
MADTSTARTAPFPFNSPRRASTINSVSSGSSIISIRVSTVAIGHCPKQGCPKVPDRHFNATLHFSRRGEFHTTPIKCDTCGTTIISIGSSSKVPSSIQQRPMHSARNIPSSSMYNITRSPMGECTLRAALAPSAQVLGAVGSPAINVPNARKSSDDAPGQQSLPQDIPLEDRSIDARDFAASSIHPSVATPEPQSGNGNSQKTLGHIIKNCIKWPLKLRNILIHVRPQKAATGASSLHHQQPAGEIPKISAGKQPVAEHSIEAREDTVVEIGTMEDVRRRSAPANTIPAEIVDHRCDCTGSCHCSELGYMRPDHQDQPGPYWAGNCYCAATPSERSLLSNPRRPESSHPEDMFHIGRAFDQKEKHRSLEVPHTNGCTRRSSSTSEAVSSTWDLNRSSSHLSGQNGTL